MRMGKYPENEKPLVKAPTEEGQEQQWMVAPWFDELEGGPFDRKMLRELYPVDPEKVGTWDEMHRECCIGDAAAQVGRGFQEKYLQDATGEVDLANGKISDDTDQWMKVKFEKECRLCLGGALFVKDGVDHAMVLPTYVYSEKKIVTVLEWKKQIKDEVRCCGCGCC